jgi:anti-sigma regulatory factor (Ser/Thr protein kinase)/anti-anti-sigma regulatory factor
LRTFKITIDRCTLHDALLIFRFKGSQDADKVGAISDYFNAAIEKGDLFIVAEMGETTFISSPAFGELMGCKKRLVEKGGNLYLVGLDTENRSKLRLMGAEKIFEFLPTIGAAIRKYHWEQEDTGDAFRVLIPPVLSFVPELRTLLSGITRMKGYSKRDAFRIEAIVDELCNNAIEHGCHEGNSVIEVFCKIFRYKVELNIINAGRSEGCGPEIIQEISSRIQGELPFNLNEKRGRGIELVKMLCDEFSVTSEADKTIIRIIKKKEV